MWWFGALMAPTIYDGTQAHVRSGRWTVGASVPILVLAPKCATTSVISFLNNCSSGLVSPNQTLCLRGTCAGTVVTHDGDIIHRHIVAGHGQRVYGLIRHPVKRFISFIKYRLSFAYAMPDFRAAGLSVHSNVSYLIDIISDQQMRRFHPFLQLTTYFRAGKATILCSFDEFVMHVQQHLQFTHCPSAFPMTNPIKRHGANSPQGSPREDQLLRIARVLHDDVSLWERACRGRGSSSIW